MNVRVSFVEKVFMFIKYVEEYVYCKEYILIF